MSAKEHGEVREKGWEKDKERERKEDTALELQLQTPVGLVLLDGSLPFCGDFGVN
jgi:hypothetical protein